MIASERAYQNRIVRIRARTQPWIDVAKLSDIRKDVLWLMAELAETRTQLATYETIPATRTGPQEARRTA